MYYLLSCNGGAKMTEVEKLKHEIKKLKAIISVSKDAKRLIEMSEEIARLETKFDHIKKHIKHPSKDQNWFFYLENELLK
jgi:archaellum component FlaC